MNAPGYHGYLRPWLADIISRIESGEPVSRIADDLTKQPHWKRLYPGEKVCPSSVQYAYERERKPWIWKYPDPRRTVVIVPAPEELHRLIGSGRSPGTWARASLARVVDLPEDAALRERWLP